MCYVGSSSNLRDLESVVFVKIEITFLPMHLYLFPIFQQDPSLLQLDKPTHGSDTPSTLVALKRPLAFAA